MARKERRGAHRYRPVRNQVVLGWRAQGKFHSTPAQIINLSISGAWLRLERCDPLPAPGKAMLSPVRETESSWVPVEILVLNRPDEGPCELKLRLLETLAYEEFKAIVWGENSQHLRSPSTTTTNHPSSRFQPEPTGPPHAPHRVDPTPAFIPWTTIDCRAERVTTAREIRTEAPSLVESHRKIRGRMDRVQPVPWLTILFFSTITIGMVFLAVLRQYGPANYLSTMLRNLPGLTAR